RISVARIDQAPDAAVRGGGGRTWQARHNGVCSSLGVRPLIDRLPAGARHGISLGEAHDGLENSGVRKLFHKQRDVLEHVSEIQTESASQHVLTASRNVIGKSNARAE